VLLLRGGGEREAHKRTFNGTTAPPRTPPPLCLIRFCVGEVFLFCGGEVAVVHLIRVSQGNGFLSKERGV
jgi:hypothetical protein